MMVLFSVLVVIELMFYAMCINYLRPRINYATCTNYSIIRIISNGDNPQPGITSNENNLKQEQSQMRIIDKRNYQTSSNSRQVQIVDECNYWTASNSGRCPIVDEVY